ncbi:MAG: protein-glutamate methylesterase/protein-glutamine glutaminase [Nitrospirota bacterium]
MSKIRVLIVDDSAYSRQTLRKILEADQAIEVAGISSDGIDAMAKTLRHKPDLITLDLEMPGMDGFSFLRWLMENKPTPVIIISSYADSKTVFRALEFGAADFIAKPSRMAMTDFRAMEKDLLRKIKGLRGLRMDRLSKNLGLLDGKKSVPVPREKTVTDIDAVGIGTSTGGPAALKIIFSRIPADFPAGIVVSQHMPKGFTASFAERLNSIAKIEVKEAAEGDSLEHGKALICPGGYHMMFTKKGKKVVTTLKESRSSDKYTPSADLMMSSLAEIYGAKTLGIILTGMGSDGREGMLEIKKRGGYTIVESEDSAVVFGMPSEAIKSGAAERILPISDIPAEMVRLVKGTGQRKGS